MPLTTKILHEINEMSSKVDGIQHGKVTIIIQDGKLVRIETTESRKVA